MKNNPNYALILLAAGKGERLGHPENKVFLPIGPKQRPIIDYSLTVFLADEACQKIIVVVRKEEQSLCQDLLSDRYGKIPEKIKLVEGGKERQDSVLNGLKQLRDEKSTSYKKVLVHDAARPFITTELVHSLVQTLDEKVAATLAIPAVDTIKQVEGNHVKTTLDRSKIWQVQTPQAFHCHVLWQAFEQAQKDQYLANEECELVERLGREVAVVQGDAVNIKITRPGDLRLAHALLKEIKEYESIWSF